MVLRRQGTIVPSSRAQQLPISALQELISQSQEPGPGVIAWSAFSATIVQQARPQRCHVALEHMVASQDSRQQRLMLELPAAQPVQQDGSVPAQALLIQFHVELASTLA